MLITSHNLNVGTLARHGGETAMANFHHQKPYCRLRPPGRTPFASGCTQRKLEALLKPEVFTTGSAPCAAGYKQT
jgi:hypothetical protein